MYHKIVESAYNGDVQAIWAVLSEIADKTWEVEKKTKLVTDRDSGKELKCSVFEAGRTSPRELNEEESDRIHKLSAVLSSKIDTMTDEELFCVMGMYYINTVPYVTRLIEHNHPTALCQYAWMLYRGEENHGIQRDIEESRKYLVRAVDRVTEITEGLKVNENSNIADEVCNCEYHITGDKTCLDFIAMIIETFCEQRRAKGTTTEGNDPRLPFEVILHMIVGGNCGGRYKGTINYYERQEDGISLKATSDVLSSFAFGSAWGIFFKDLMTGADKVEVERNMLV